MSDLKYGDIVYQIQRGCMNNIPCQYYSSWNVNNNCWDWRCYAKDGICINRIVKEITYRPSCDSEELGHTIFETKEDAEMHLIYFN